MTVLPLGALLLVTACGAADRPGAERGLDVRRPGAAGIDPCRVLDAGALGTYGTFADGRPGTVDGARACTWDSKPAGGAPDRMSVVVSVRERKAVAEVAGIGLRTDELNGRVEALLPLGENSCTVSLAVGRTSRVDVTVRKDGHQGVAGSNDQACGRADAVANLVEPALPDAR